MVIGEPGTWVFKPRNQWHTFWNASDTPCEIVELISPAVAQRKNLLEEQHPDMVSFTLPAAAVVLSQIPLILLFVLTHRWLRRGIYAGAVK